jgi:drug/metabolite transporter (DMT)-like permease
MAGNERRLAWFFVFLSLFFQLGSMVFGKQAALVAAGDFSVSGIANNHWYFLSLSCLGLQAIVWPLALRHLQLFLAYLVISLTYACIPILAHLVFAEILKPVHIISSVLILTGVLLVATGGRKAAA